MYVQIHADWSAGEIVRGVPDERSASAVLEIPDSDVNAWVNGFKSLMSAKCDELGVSDDISWGVSYDSFVIRDVRRLSPDEAAELLSGEISRTLVAA